MRGRFAATQVHRAQVAARAVAAVARAGAASILRRARASGERGARRAHPACAAKSQGG